MKTPWKTLPPELWLEIAQHVNGVLDTVRFRSVCKVWRSSLQSPATLTPKPTSIIPSPLDLKKSCLLEERTIYQVRGLPKYYQPFVGLEQVYSNENNSSNNNDGTINKLKFRAYHLFYDSKTSSQEIPKELDVINNDGISLSQVYTYYYTDVPKLDIVVNNDVMVALLDGKLAMLRRGAMQWETIESKCKYDDVVVYNGKFFLVDRHGGGFILDQNTLQVSKIVAPVHNRKNIYVTGRKGYELILCRKRLVMNFATGDLYLLILWRRRSSELKRATIKVYKISDDGLEWNEIESIGNRVIFIGRNFGFCFDVQEVKLLPYMNCIVHDGSSSFPDYEGGKTYFWGDLDGYLISVYNIRDETSFPPLRQSIYQVFN